MEQDEYDDEREPEFRFPEVPNDAFSEFGDTLEDAADAMEDAQPGEIVDEDGFLAGGDALVDDGGAAEAVRETPPSDGVPAMNVIADATSDAEPAAAQAFDRSSEERDRIDHPTRYSPVTGERAPPNHFYLPRKPPEAPSLDSPSNNMLATIQAAVGDPSTKPPADPPRSAPAVDRPAQGSDRVPLAVDTAAPAPREDIGQPLPRVLVTVSLAAARNLFDDALEDASRQMAERFRKLALNEIDRAAFLRRAAERAADYSLRGPIC